MVSMAVEYTISPKKIPGTIRIMTFNVRGFTSDDKGVLSWHSRLPQQIQMLKDFDPDIIGFQEPNGIETIAFHDRLGDSYKWIGKSRGMICERESNALMVGKCNAEDALCQLGFDAFCDGEYSPLFYKKDLFTRIDKGTFWLNEGMKKYQVGWDAGDLRICTWTQLQIKKSKKLIMIANTHLDNIGINARTNGFGLVVDFVHEKTGFKIPAMILGDFNADTSLFQSTLDQNNLADARSIAQSIVGPQDGTFTNYQPHAQMFIDHFILDGLINGSSSYFEVKQYGIIERADGFFLSDHRPVFIDIVIK